ncbi:hypothetical protein F4780DRAFT_667307 [Xylariomycetidae sp. FL0641]|nr:hypothetical protein F4780DRAFT_667307 [Xylariomycetidae sp. FL0641]
MESAQVAGEKIKWSEDGDIRTIKVDPALFEALRVYGDATGGCGTYPTTMLRHMRESGCVWIAHDPAKRIIPAAWKAYMDRKRYAYYKVYPNARTDDGGTSSDVSELGPALDDASDQGAGRALPPVTHPFPGGRSAAGLSDQRGIGDAGQAVPRVILPPFGGSAAAGLSSQGGVNLITPHNPVAGSGQRV